MLSVSKWDLCFAKSYKILIFARFYARVCVMYLKDSASKLNDKLTGSAMCKRSTSATYLKVNALQDNAQPFVFPVTIIVGQFL